MIVARDLDYESTNTYSQRSVRCVGMVSRCLYDPLNCMHNGHMVWDRQHPTDVSCAGFLRYRLACMIGRYGFKGDASFALFLPPKSGSGAPTEHDCAPPTTSSPTWSFPCHRHVLHVVQRPTGAACGVSLPTTGGPPSPIRRAIQYSRRTIRSEYMNEAYSVSKEARIMSVTDQR